MSAIRLKGNNYLIKGSHFLKNIGKSLFSFLKAVTWFLVGCFLVLVSFQLLASIFRNWHWESILITSIYILMLAVIIIIGSILILMPFRKWVLVKKALNILIMPLAGFVKLGNYYLGLAAIYFELVTMGAIGLIVFGGFRKIQPFHALNDRVGYYLVLTVTILVFNFWGQKITGLIIGKGKNQEDFSWIIHRMQPSIIRFVIYSIAAVLYLIANIELFSGVMIFAWPEWMIFKEVIVQVFLTYIAVDGALVAWRDHKETIKGVVNLGAAQK